MSEPVTGLREAWAASNPALDTSPMEIVDLIRRINGLLERAVEPLYDETTLTPSDVALLIKLRHQRQPLMGKRIAEMSSMSKAGVSKALQRLERQGYLERQASPADKRATLVSLTDRGRAAIDEIFPRQLAVEAEVLAGLDDRAALVADLASLASTIEAALRG